MRPPSGCPALENWISMYLPYTPQVTPLTDSDSTHKSTGVVVSDSLCIAKRFQQRVGLQNDVFHPLHRYSIHTVEYTITMSIMCANIGYCTTQYMCYRLIRSLLEPRPLYLYVRTSPGHLGHVLHDVLGTDRLACSTLPTAHTHTQTNDIVCVFKTMAMAHSFWPEREKDLIQGEQIHDASFNAVAPSSEEIQMRKET